MQFARTTKKKHENQQAAKLTNFANFTITKPLFRGFFDWKSIVITSLPLPDQAYLLECFIYEAHSGKLLWKLRPVSSFALTNNRTSEQIARMWNKRFPGTEAAHANNQEYQRVGLNGKKYLAHRIIYKILHGIDPVFIDHISGGRAENLPNNLRSVSHTDNMRNSKINSSNKSNASGVYFHSTKGCWAAQIGVNGKKIHLGYFTEKQEALTKRSAAEKLYGFHPNHGRLI